jgi:type IV pilus assembly protein PilQ
MTVRLNAILAATTLWFSFGGIAHAQAVTNQPAAEAGVPTTVESAPAPTPTITVSNDLFSAETAANGTPTPTIEVPPVEENTTGIEIEQAGGDSDKITVTLDDVPLKDVIRMFSRISGANIVAKDELEGRVTVSLTNVGWKEALEAILETADLVLVEKRPNIYSVILRADLATEPLVVDTIFLNYITTTNVMPVVRQMLVSTNATVTALPAANAIIITETATQIVNIRKVITQIDKPRPQVYIEAKFVELNDSAIEDLGINWQALQNYTIGAGELSRNYTRTRRQMTTDTPGTFAVDRTTSFQERNSVDETNSDRAFNQDLLANAVLGNSLSRGASSTDINSSNSTRQREVSNVLVSGKNFEDFTVDSQGSVTIQSVPNNDITDVRSAVLSASEFALTLSMLKQMDGASVISNPKVLVSNGEQAMIHVGRNEPNIVALPQGDQGNTYAYQLDQRQPFIEIGIKLKVRPTINTEENITIKVEPELSRLLGQKSVGEAQTTFPITQVRKINTEFNVESGKTVAIGGLTETTDKDAVKKLPVLGDIPIIGKYLFTHRHDESIQDEVIIFVTVESANPKKIEEFTGLPSRGRLIHKHLEEENLRKAAAASDAKAPGAAPNAGSDIDKILEQIKKDKAATVPAEAAPASPAAPTADAAASAPAAPVSTASPVEPVPTAAK